MKIYIKTPFYKLSKYIPHLIEHTANNNINLENSDYFDNIHNTTLTTYSAYTLFEIPNYLDIDKFIKKICSEIDGKLISKEKKVLKQELENKYYKLLLFEKI
jgi:hypothetical protein